MNRNIIKTINYMKRNGVKKAVGMAYERLTAHYDAEYCYTAPEKEELKKQRNAVFSEMPFISIAVPVYETKETFLAALIDSVTAQSYENWELILADASESGSVKDCVEEKKKSLPEHTAAKIRYHALPENEGISGNSNRAIALAAGDYIGLLDHDDLLTPDALYEMVSAVNRYAEETGIRPRMLYSDEDKCDETAQNYYEPNSKSEFNLDFLLSNNYICHFLMLEAGLMKKLGFRGEYDGSQDYDLILRAVDAVPEEEIVHVERVLYHWRCHERSTAGNSASKSYAYEAGKKALQDFLDRRNLKGRVEDTDHVGFYRIAYEPDLLTARRDVAAAGGSVLDRNNRITSGILLPDGSCPFRGLQGFFSGPANAAAVSRDAYALDARTILLRDKDIPLYEEMMKVPYVKEIEKRDRAYCGRLDENIWKQRSMALCAALRDSGKRLLWDPQIRVWR